MLSMFRINYSDENLSNWMQNSNKFAKYLTDGEFRIIGLSHGVVNKSGHHFPDLVQITGPGLLKKFINCL